MILILEGGLTSYLCHRVSLENGVKLISGGVDAWQFVLLFFPSFDFKEKRKRISATLELCFQQDLDKKIE